jgi:hypothetical protein
MCHLGHEVRRGGSHDQQIAARDTDMAHFNFVGEVEKGGVNLLLRKAGNRQGRGKFFRRLCS